MANPIAVKGLSKLIDRVGDEVMQSAKKALNQGQKNYRVYGLLEQEGKFAFDKDGEIGFVGNVIVKIPPDATVIELTDGSEAHLDIAWDSIGDGTLKVKFEVEVTSAGE